MNDEPEEVHKLTDLDPASPGMTPPSGRLVRVAAWCAYTSGLIATAGILFLVAFFSMGGVFGPLNDVAVIFHYTLMLPLALALHRRLRQSAPRLSWIALWIGVVGMVAVVTLQTLLVVGVLPFQEQIVWVIPAFLVVLVWFVLVRHLDRTREILPESMLVTILAGLYFGYPIWAFQVSHRLVRYSQAGRGSGTTGT